MEELKCFKVFYFDQRGHRRQPNIYIYNYSICVIRTYLDKLYVFIKINFSNVYGRSPRLAFMATHRLRVPSLICYRSYIFDVLSVPLMRKRNKRIKPLKRLCCKCCSRHPLFSGKAMLFFSVVPSINLITSSYQLFIYRKILYINYLG